MEMASIRENVIKMMKRTTKGAQMSMEQTLRNLEQLRKMADSLADNAERSDQNMRLARRPDVPSVGRPQAPTPIRKLQKRVHLRKEETKTTAGNSGLCTRREGRACCLPSDAAK
ncbi:hypothetical protein RB195_007135 [Necator americanus]